MGNKRKQIEEALAVLAQHPPDVGYLLGGIPPTWIGVCRCRSWLRWGSPREGRFRSGAKCHKVCRRDVHPAPFQNVLWAAFLFGGPPAVAVAAEELFYTLPNGQ